MKESLLSGIAPLDLINDHLMKSMEELGNGFAEGLVSLSHLLKGSFITVLLFVRFNIPREIKKSIYGKENIYEINDKEMYEMSSNILSIKSDTVISDPNFIRLNNWLESIGLKVEKVTFTEVSKQEGLFRCSSLPLIRN